MTASNSGKLTIGSEFLKYNNSAQSAYGAVHAFSQASFSVSSDDAWAYGAASFEDILTVNFAPLTGKPGALYVYYNVDGSTSSTKTGATGAEIYYACVSTQINLGTPEVQGTFVCYPNSVSEFTAAPNVFTFVFAKPFSFRLYLEADTGTPIDAPLSGSGSGTVDFSVVLSGFSVSDSNGYAVNGASFASASGTAYGPDGVVLAPMIRQGGIVPISSAVSIIQPGSWVSIYGSGLADGTFVWNGDFPTSLGGTSVTIDGKSAYLSFVSPTQINVQAPDDTATGLVNVVVATGPMSTTSTVTLAKYSPSFCLLDGNHVAGIIPRSDGSGAYGGGTYDILGPTGTSLGYATVAAKPGDTVALYGVGFGPTNPAVPAGKAFSGTADTTNPVHLTIGSKHVTPSFAGLSAAGIYQINLTIPAGSGTGDLPLVATVEGAETQPGVVISLK